MMQKKIFLFFISLSLSLSALSQLAPFQDEDGLIVPTFQYDVIKGKKVATLLIHYQFKPDGERVKDDGLVKFFRFDEEGRLIESYYTIKTGYEQWDTSRTFYYYDKEGNLSIKRTNAGVFLDSWYFAWYPDGNFKKRAHVHEVPMAGIGDFKIASQTVISNDSFAYVSYPKQLQRYGYNEEKTVYEKAVTQYDDMKRIISRYSHYSVGWIYSQVDFKYDTKGRVNEFTFTGNLSGETKHSIHIEYDSTGAVQSQKLFNDMKETDEVQYIYDSKTGLITNQLDRDYVKSGIGIASFTYEFR